VPEPGPQRRGAGSLSMSSGSHHIRSERILAEEVNQGAGHSSGVHDLHLVVSADQVVPGHMSCPARGR